MSVLKTILEWSQDRPAWQRDALRRLVLNGELSDEDVLHLTEICKSPYGLADQPDVVPLSAEHLPDTDTASGQVTLLSIFHHRGVNALAEDQTLKFAPGLTVVYGDNAAGKTPRSASFGSPLAPDVTLPQAPQPRPPSQSIFASGSTVPVISRSLGPWCWMLDRPTQQVRFLK